MNTQITKTVCYLPLDERPCNRDFAPMLFSSGEFQMRLPERLGDKKVPAEWEDIRAFLLASVRDADGLVISLDMLLYGGLIPSRLHSLDREAVMERLQLLREIRAQRPDLPVFAFQCIMRCPQYSSSDEEPDYYETCGREIFLEGVRRHREALGLDAPKEGNTPPVAALQDYLQRRAFNLSMNLATLDLVREGVIDFLVIPQDDSAPYGWTAMDQEKVREKIRAERISSRVLMYPGADEVGLTLTSRMALHFAGRVPKVQVQWASVRAPFLIPLYEDRMLGETVKYHLMAAGCCVCSALSDADMVLGIPAPAERMREAAYQEKRDPNYQVGRNLPAFLFGLREALRAGKIVTLSDNAYANGSDLELVEQMDEMGLCMDIHGYAGWNTSSNTLGTAIAEGVHALLSGRNQAHMDFQAMRYVEDALYCATVRARVTEQVEARGMSYFLVDGQRGEAAGMVRQELERGLATLPSLREHIRIEDVYLPWRRMFEVGLRVSWKE